jgi:4'-phosphopantetheinyl transferase
LNARDPTSAIATTVPPQSGVVSVWLALPQSINFFDAAQLSEAERERFAARRSPQRRGEFAVSRALVSRVGAPREAATSLTHGSGLAAMACGPPDSLIGVDLERHRRRDVLSIARFAFAPAESAALAALPAARQLHHFYTLWVMKEALAKALQLRLMDALANCVITATKDGWRGAIPTAHPWRLAVFEPQPDLSLAVACVGATAGDLRVECAEWPPTRSVEWPVAASLGACSAVAGC